MTKFIDVLVNGKWNIKLPEHIADLPMWKFWEKERMAAMYAAIRPTDTILDIGTCNGDMSAIFASWLSDKGRIILVEPSPDFWPLIKAIFEANKLIPYQTFPVLVSNESNDTPDASQATWPDAAYDDIKLETGFAHLNEKPDIPVIKIDDMQLQKIDIITMDIEGSEYEALQGAEQTILKDKPTIFVSVHPEFMWREHHHSPDDLLVMLQKWGYEMTYLGFDHEQHYLGKYRGEK